MPAALLDQGVAAVTAEDSRWARRDIKSTALLANLLLKKMAADAGAFETILLDNGKLTEGSSTSVHVISERSDSYAAQRLFYFARHHARGGDRARGAVEPPPQ